MSIALALKAYNAWEGLKNLQMGKIDDAALAKVASMFGHEITVEQSGALTSVLATQDPTETLGQFVSSGGLLALIAQNNGFKPPALEAAQDIITRCPHCEELHLVGA